MKPEGFESLTIASRREETPYLTMFELAGGSEAWRASNRHAGQFAALRLDGGDDVGYMVFASRPAAPRVQFLVGSGGRFGDAFRSLEVGAKVDVSRAMGAGFPLEKARGGDLWLVATGSGIAALRPVVGEVIADREAYGDVHLLYGVRATTDIALGDEIERWRESIDVAISLSGDDAKWTSHRGYVQLALRTLAKRLEGAHLFVCGRPEMVEAVRTTAAELGIDPTNVATNY